MNKAELRKIIMRSLGDLTEPYKNTADAKITESIIALPEYKDSTTVFCFAGTSDEIDTSELIDKMLSDNKTVCVPLCTEPGIMQARKITSRDDLSEGKFGIMEPGSDSELIARDAIDFAVIPCVTCNKRGQRLGHGGGYYDRFFEDLETAAAVICREETMTAAIPTDAHDITFKIVVSERGTYRND